MGQNVKITGYIPTRFVLFTSSAAQNLVTATPLSKVLTVTDAQGNPITGLSFSKVGGLDAALFGLSGNTLTMTAKNVAAPVDSNADNVYEVLVEATDPQYGFAARQLIKITVTP
jgi:hypothetical protein